MQTENSPTLTPRRNGRARVPNFGTCTTTRECKFSRMHIHTRTRTHTSLPYMGTCVPTGKAVQWPLVGCGADFEHVDHECIHTHEPAPVPAAGQSSERSRVNVEMATFSRPPSTYTRPQNPMISQLESSIQRRMRYVSWGLTATATCAWRWFYATEAARPQDKQ